MSATSPTAPAHVFYYEMAAPQYTLSCPKYADSELYEATTDPGFLYARPAAATIYGADTTLAATTGSPSGVTSTQATFNGTVTPGGIYEAAYYFQYGPTTAYGSQTTPVPVGPGLAAQAASTTVDGLTPGTAYHYRFVVSDTNGSTVDGLDTLMPPVVVSASPANVTAGRPVTVSWSGVSDPTSTDWVGLYQPGAPASSYVDWFYANSCTQTSSGPAPASGSCTYTMPVTAGTYELRLYAGTATDLLTTSNSITSVPPPPVNSAAPVISGASGHRSAYVGDTLSCPNGTWSNAPTAFVYEWASGSSPVLGATGQTYVVQRTDLGHSLSCGVTASNAGGAGSPAMSAKVVVVSPPPNTLLLSEKINRSRHSATFRFRATGTSTGFRCALVRKPTRKGAKTPSPHYSSCGSSKTFKHLKAGTYELYVRAVGPGGVDKTPATYKFKIT
jgi:hypothetical protein